MPKQPAAKPVTIKGVTYPSIFAAGKALGVKAQTVRMAIRRGTTDSIGLGSKMVDGHQINSEPLTIRGVRYPSQTIAAEVLGVTQGAISNAIRRGTLDTVGTGERASRKKF